MDDADATRDLYGVRAQQVDAAVAALRAALDGLSVTAESTSKGPSFPDPALSLDERRQGFSEFPANRCSSGMDAPTTGCDPYLGAPRRLIQ